MRVLLDTNILIHRETANVVRPDIGDVFRWLDRIGADKCIHPRSIEEIRRHQDPRVVQSFEAKLRSYYQLQTLARDTLEILRIRESDRSRNDTIDTDLICEVYANRVELLLSEDKGIHDKAQALGIEDRVLCIETFLEQAMREHPELVDYHVLSVKQELFGNINVNEPFFDTFRNDYPAFDQWFNRKADEVAYVCRSEDNTILAFMYLKPESIMEVYSDIIPIFLPRRRLKIGSFKVAHYGFKLGERFLKIVFDNALRFSTEEIYVTIFENTVEQKCLIALLENWGFSKYGVKNSGYGEEGVWVRSFVPIALEQYPASTYPYMSLAARKFIVSIRPEYHTKLFPDSILNTESPLDFVEDQPYSNAIRKAFISRSYYRDLRCGDIIVFYRTGDGVAPAHYTAVATTLGVVESIRTEIHDFNDFRRACKGVSVFSDDELRQQWDYNQHNRPFVVQFLCTYSLPRRPNLAKMKEEGVLIEYPRGFEPLTNEGFIRLLEISDARNCPVVD
ncbi:MAG: PIN domain-containing protein [Candidatus Aminicenantes bacterium]|nr:PIN domain-containing protein [Candidatus Aminicenantes bacterium]